MQVLQHRIDSCQEAGRNVVVAGDLNIAPYPIDHCDFVRAPQRCRPQLPGCESAQTSYCSPYFAVPCVRIQADSLEGRPDRAWMRRMLQPDDGQLVDLHRCHNTMPRLLIT